MKDIKSNGFHDIIAQAIEEMKSEQGENFSLDRINLAELQRRVSSSGYGSYVWQIVESEGVWEYTVNNEYYCYSNVGYGAALSLPVADLSIAHASVIIACALMLAIVFKGVLFPCLKRR